MKAPHLQPVQFHQDTIHLVEFNGNPFTPVKPLCENIGIAWQSQRTKLSAESARWNCNDIVTVAADGKEREMLCLPPRKLNGWLMTVNPRKVKPEIRDRLIQYQNECDEVLWNYWTKDDALLLDMETSAIDAACEASAAATLTMIQSAGRGGYSASFLSDIIRYCSAGLSYAECGRLLNVSTDTARRYGGMALTAGLIDVQPSACHQLSLFPEV